MALQKLNETRSLPGHDATLDPDLEHLPKKILLLNWHKQSQPQPNRSFPDHLGEVTGAWTVVSLAEVIARVQKLFVPRLDHPVCRAKIGVLWGLFGGFIRLQVALTRASTMSLQEQLCSTTISSMNTI